MTDRAIDVDALRERHPRDCYACVRCQTTHIFGYEPELFEAHIGWQSKRGISRLDTDTMAFVARRKR